MREESNLLFGAITGSTKGNEMNNNIRVTENPVARLMPELANLLSQ